MILKTDNAGGKRNNCLTISMQVGFLMHNMQLLKVYHA